MKARVAQTLFVLTAILVALLIMRQGGPHLIARSPAGEQPRQGPMVNPADTRDAYAIVASQLMALRRHDFEAAAACQSEALLRRFSTTANFKEAMETRYPAFLSFQGFSIGPAETWDGGQHILVPIILKQDRSPDVEAVYELGREGAKLRVNGVQGGLTPRAWAKPGSLMPQPRGPIPPAWATPADGKPH